MHALILFMVAASANAEPPPTVLPAPHLQQTIETTGAPRAARTLDDPRFGRALRHAAAGDPMWLRAIVRLRGGTDAARSEGIDRALSDALQTNPAQVLALVRSHPDLPRVAWLCEDRAIEPSVGAVRRFTVRATRAVRSVRAPALRPLRDQCLAALAG